MANKPKAGTKQPADTRELRQRKASEPPADTAPPATTSNCRKKPKVPEEDEDSDFEETEWPDRKRTALSETPQPRVTRAAKKKADLEPASLPAPDAERRGDSVVDATTQYHGSVPTTTTAYSMPGQAQGHATIMGQVYHGYQPVTHVESAYQQVPQVERAYQQVDQVESAYQLAPHANNPYQQVPQLNNPYQQVPRLGSPFQNPVRQGPQGNSSYHQAPQLNSPYQQVPRPDNPYQQIPQLNPPYQQVPQLGSPFRSPIRQDPQVNSPYQQLPQPDSPYRNVSHVDRGNVPSLADGQSPRIGQDIEGSEQSSSSLMGHDQLGLHRANFRAFIHQGRTSSSVGDPSPNRPPPRFTLGDRINTSPIERPSPPMQVNLTRTPILQPVQYPGSRAGFMHTQASPTRPMQAGSSIPSFGQMQFPPPFFGLPGSSNVPQRIRAPSFGAMHAQGSPVRPLMNQGSLIRPMVNQGSLIRPMVNQGPTTGFMQPPYHGQGRLPPTRSMQNQGPTMESMLSPYLRQDQALSTSLHHTASNEQVQQPSSGLSRATSVGPSQLASLGRIQFHDSRNLTAAPNAPLQPSTFGKPQDFLSGSNLSVSVGPSQLFPHGQIFLPSGRAMAASNAPFQPSLLGQHEMTNIDQMSSPGSNNMATPESIQAPPGQIKPSAPALHEHQSSLQGNASPGQSNMPSIQDSILSTLGNISSFHSNESPVPSLAIPMQGPMPTCNQDMVASPDAQPEPTPVSAMGPAISDEIQSENGEGSDLFQQLEADARFIFGHEFDKNFIVIPDSQQQEDGGQRVQNKDLDDASPSNAPKPSGISAAQQPTGEPFGSQQPINPLPVVGASTNQNQDAFSFLPQPGVQASHGQYAQTQTGREHIWVNQTGYFLMRKVISDNGETFLPPSKLARIINGDDLGKIASKMYDFAVDFQNGIILDRFSRFCGSFSSMKLVTLAHLNVLPSWWLMRTIVKDTLAKAGYVVDDALAVRFFDLAQGMSQDFLASAQSTQAGGAGYVGLAAAMAAAHPPSGA